MIAQHSFAALDVLGWIVVILFVVWFSGVVLLNTSFGLRLGYDMWRIMPVSLVWPLLHYSDRLDQWAKQGTCTLPDDHPLRTD